MGQRIVIDPVTRIEGHAKITVLLDDDGRVSDARFHVTDFRGFEKFCEGRPFWEMPGITARVCGICPVSHLLASSKAGDAILAVSIPPAAVKLRRLMNLAQIVQSHALSVFHLSGPDLLLGMDSDPAQRNVFGLIAKHPEVARAGIRLRQFGQEIIEALGGRKIHPAWSVPGGVRAALTVDGREAIRGRLAEAKQTALMALGLIKGLLDGFREEVASFGDFPSLFLAMVGPDGVWEHHDGRLRVTDSTGRIVADDLDPADYRDFLGESVEPDSYLKSPYYAPMGCPDGIYRVGPLARLNVCSRAGSPLADVELEEYRQRGGRTVTASFYYHYARLVEILTAVEHVERLLDDPDLLSDQIRAHGGVNRMEGVGASEAPRGTLFHHYRVDENGLLTWVNLIIATGHNNLAMNKSLAQIARHFIKGSPIPEGVLNRLEAGIRAFDPCLSCSTHAFGLMPLHVQVVGPDGAVRDEIWRH
ncbi:Ni/Fe hydrogenase subunit alpha [Paludisphaera borealis]|uniref:NAD-reducing hydrogenase n=1 Tax=Paludisphaera borealis TaxID=1387353 RepID=A0A1U7CSQ1_9BACT|nr:Ni/Fe hydrogenase subunit alpha [Paludisphaera borealis]APW61938.1 NAD-reducing hydrogenase [Paludisphaera borealis]